MDQKGVIQVLRSYEVSEQGTEWSLNSSFSTQRLMILHLSSPVSHYAVGFKEGMQRKLHHSMALGLERFLPRALNCVGILGNQSRSRAQAPHLAGK